MKGKLCHGQQCNWCGAYRKYNSTTKEMMAIRDCCAPDGDGHAWIQADWHEYEDGEPCDHPGCSAHVSHPCENCGRIQCKGVAQVRVFMW